MRVVLKTLISIIPLTACASVQAETPIHEMARWEAPRWKMESLAGLDNYLLKIYETGLDEEGNGYKLEVGNIDFEEFSKSSANLIMHGKTEFDTEKTIHIGISSCNAIMGKFDNVENKLIYRLHGQSMTSCERLVTDNSGKSLVLPTPMLVDEYIVNMLPKIKDYRVSRGNQKLTLFTENEEVLGVFVRKEAAE